MARRFVNQLGSQESVNETFLASNKQLRSNRNGNLYLMVDLSDSTGSISARMWNASESVYQSFQDGDFVRVQGTTQVYQGAIQLIASQIVPVPREEVRLEEFLTLTPDEIETMLQQIGRMLRSMRDPHLRALAETFLSDTALIERLTRTPAGVKHHHAYPGGLVEHVAKLMEVVDRVADCYPEIDRDLLLMGAFLHDIGKVAELSSEQGLAYTDEGQLIGHLVIAVRMLSDKIRETEQRTGETVPHDTRLRLEHMIISHHGQYEYGSPKLPMTLEAIALHHLDNLDAKIQCFSQLMQDDRNVESPWTIYHANLGRKLYKGNRPASSPDEASPSAPS